MPQAKIGVIGGTGLYEVKEVDKMKNGSYKAPVISPWLSSDGEAACILIISHIICLSRCQ